MKKTLHRLMLTCVLTFLSLGLFAQIKLFEEGFESGNLTQKGWTQDPTTVTTSWAVGNGLNNITPQTGTFLAYLYASSPQAPVRLIAPIQNLSSLTEPILSLSVAAPKFASGDRDTLRLLYRTSATGAWVKLQDVIPTIDNWIRTYLVLSDFNVNTSGSFQFALEYRYGAGKGIFLDNITLGSSALCSAAPSALTAYNITDARAMFSWNAPPTTSQYNLKVSTVAMTDMTQTADVFDGIVYIQPFVLSTNLNPSTTYYWYVQNDCGQGDVSPWSAQGKFTTLCSPVTALPLSEGFEDVGTTSTSFPSCWIKGVSQTGDWGTATLSTTYIPQCSSSQKRTGSASLSLSGYYDNSSTSYTSPRISSAWAATPAIIVNAATNYQVTFWLRGATTSKLHVGLMRDPNDEATFLEVAEITPSESNVWEEFILPVALTSNYRHVAFRMDGADGAATATIYIDDVKIEESPTCPKPSQLRSTGITGNSASLSWQGSAAAQNYTVKFATATIDPSVDPGSFTMNSTTNSLSITTLNPLTTYYWYVQANCGAGDLSAWSNGGTFTTGCGAQTTFPYEESFTGTTFLPACWQQQRSVQMGTTTTMWARTTSTYKTSPGGAYISAITAGNKTNLVLPAMNIPTANQYRIRFWMQRSSLTTPDALKVWVNTTPDTVGGTQLLHIYRGNTLAPVESTTGWYEYAAVIPNSGVVYLLFEAISAYGSAIYIDDVVVEELPNCSDITQMSTSNLTDSSVTLNWQFSTMAKNTPSQYNIKISTTSIDPATDTADIFTGTSNTLSIAYKGLLPATTYYWYVQGVCGASQGKWSQEKTFKTPCAPLPIPFVERFSNATFPADCWGRYAELASSVFGGAALSTSSTLWSRITTSYGIAEPHPKLNIYGTGRKEWLITPAIKIDIPDAHLVFDLALTDYGNGDISEKIGSQPDDQFIVAISTDEGQTWSSSNATVWNNQPNGDFVYDQIPNVAQPVSIDLSAYSGQTIKIGFYGESTITNGDNDLHIGNIVIERKPSCPPVTKIVVSGLRDTSVTFTWLPGGAETFWDAVLVPTGGDPNTGTPISLSSSPATIGSLQANTSYDLYVRANCGSGDYSTWNVRSIPFKTHPTPTPTPYLTDFEDDTDNSAWILANGTQTNKWHFGAAAAQNGAKGLYISNDNGSSNAYGHTASYVYAYRVFDLKQGEFTLEFDWRAVGESTYDLLRAFLVPANISLTGGAINGMSGSTNTVPSGWIALDGGKLNLESNWVHHKFDTIITNGGFYNVVFFWKNDGTGGVQPPAAVDNVVINNRPLRACGYPYDLSIQGLTGNSATIAWTADVPATFEIKVSTTPINPETDPGDMQLSSGYTSFMNITSLSPATRYYVYVQADCSDGTPSYWSDEYTFMTLCAPQALPYVENFNTYGSGTGILPICFQTSVIKTGATPASSLYVPYCHKGVFYGTDPSDSISMQLYAYYGSSGAAISKSFVVLPKMSSSLDSLYMTFMSRSTATANKLYVGVVDDVTDMSTFELVKTFDLTTSWDSYLVKFDSIQQGEYIVLSVDGDANTKTYTAYVDQIKVDIESDCQPAFDFSANVINGDSVHLFWSRRSPNDVQWEVKISQVATNDPDTLGTLVLIDTVVDTNPNVLLTGLTALTNYYAYVRVKCPDNSWGSYPLVPYYEFRSGCSPIRNIPFAEKFDTYGTGTTSRVECWTVGSSTSTKPYCSTGQKTSGAASLYMISDSAGYSYAALPKLEIPIQNLQLYFNAYKVSAALNVKVGVMTDPTDISTFTLVEKKVFTEGSWHEMEVNFTGYTGTGQYIALKVDSGTKYTSGFYIDDVMLDVYSTCKRPADLAMTNRSQTTLEIEWLAKGTESAWDVAYGTRGFNPTTGGTHVSVTGSPYTITGLTASTTYDIYVRANCGASNVSSWRGPLMARTASVITPIPFVCDFENPAINSTWDITSNGGTNVWYIGSAISNGGSNSLYISNNQSDNNYGTGISYTYASRLFKLAPGSYALSFDWKGDGESSWDLLRAFTIPVTDDLSAGDPYGMTGNTNTLPVGWVDVGGGVLNKQTTWQHVEKVFTVTDTTTIQLAFFWKSDGSGVYNPPAAVDNISFDRLLCDLPTDLVAENISDISVDLEWSAGGNEMAWDISYGLSGFSPDSGTIVRGITDSAYTLTGLTKNTLYSAYIRSRCDTANNVSFWIGPVSFLTKPTLTPLPFICDFENTALDNTWAFSSSSSSTSSGVNKWHIGSATANGGTRSLYISNDNAANAYSTSSASYAYAYLVFNVTPGVYEFSFDWKASGESVTTSHYDLLRAFIIPSTVDLSTAPTFGMTGNTNTTPAGWLDVGGGVLNQQTTWQHVEQLLTASDTVKVQLAFFWKNDASGGVQPPAALDNIVFKTAVCYTPYDLKISQITDSSAVMGGTTDASLWELKVDTVSYTLAALDTITAAIYDGTISTMPYTINVLDANTTYYYYIRSICTPDTSKWASGGSFKTSCLPITVPFTEKFDSHGTGTGKYPTCWTMGGTNTTLPYCSSSYKFANSTASLYLPSTATTYSYALLPQVVDDVSLMYINFMGYKTAADYRLTIGVMSDPTDIATFDSITTITPSAVSTWAEFNVYFGNYTGNGKYIALLSDRRAANAANYFYVDSLTVDYIPSCIQPANLRATQMTPTTVDVTWDPIGQETAWEYVYGVPGFDPSLSTPNTVTMQSTQISGLVPNTYYQIYVRSSCGSTESDWSNPITVLTYQQPATLPYTENFETPANNLLWSFKHDKQANKWHVGGAVYKDGVNSLYISKDTGATHSYSNIATSYSYAYRTLDLDSALYDISFDWMANGEDKYDLINVFFIPESVNIEGGNAFGMTGSTNTTPAGWIALGSNLSTKTTWQSLSIETLPVNIAGRYNLTFFWKNDASGGTQPPAAVDNIVVKESSCYTKNNQVTNITNSSAHLSWVGDVQDYELIIDTINHNESALDTISGIVNTTVTNAFTYDAINLSGNTTYYYYVRGICGTTERSKWLKGSFKTWCDVMTIPYAENFDTYGTTTTSLPDCWKRGGSIASPTVYCSSSYKYNNSTASLYVGATTATAYNYAVLPAFNNISTLEISFMAYKASSAYRIVVGVMTDPTDFSTFDSLAVLTPPTTSTWGELRHSFASYSGTGQYIALLSSGPVTGGANYIYIDNLLVDIITTCDRPTGLTASNATTSTIDVAWTAGGTETAWEVKYGTTGFNVLNSGTTVNATTPTVQLTGLAGSTMYDIYVRALCGGSDGNSRWRGPVSLATVQTPEVLPFITDFENDLDNAKWRITKNSTGVNVWHIGSAIAQAGTKSLYVSDDNGVSNYYATGTISYSYAYRLFDLQAQAYNIRFNWRSDGEGNWDLLRAFLIPDNVDISTGSAFGMTGSTNTVPAGWIALDKGVLSKQTTWQLVSNVVNVPTAGRYKLAFFWKNDGSGGLNPPAVVDNVFFGEPVTYTYSANTCIGYGYTGHGFNILATDMPTAQTYTFTRTGINTAGGADSLVVLNLVVNPNVETRIPVSICQGTSYTGNGFTNITTAGEHRRNMINPATNCDSTIILVVTVNPVYNLSDAVTILTSALPYTYRDTVFGTNTPVGTRTYIFHRQTKDGCDSITTLTLTVDLGNALDNIDPDHTFNLSPNPVRRGSTVEVEAEFTPAERTGLKVEVFNSVGMRVAIFEPKEYPILISGFDQSGTYIVRITTGTNRQLHGKVIVK